MSRINHNHQQHNRNKSQLSCWPVHHSSQFPPGLYVPEPVKFEVSHRRQQQQRNSFQGPRNYYGQHHYSSTSNSGMEDLAMATKVKYVKKYPDQGEKLLSQCSTSSSEEDNNNNRPQQSFYPKRDRTFVVYHEGMPVYDGVPTETDTKSLLYSFMANPEDKFCCSELKNGPKDISTIDMPSFMDM